MMIEPLSGPVARAVEATKDLHKDPYAPRHFLRFCSFCYRSFGIDTLTTTNCCRGGNVHDSSGTLAEIHCLEDELKKERENDN